MPRLLSGLAMLALAAQPGSAGACTTFVMDGASGPLIGKSYDWDTADGLVLVNKKGSHKRALVLGAGTPAEWTSAYASLTFNQYGAELPNGGMNTAGLVVEIMWLVEARVPAPDGRPTLTELQWIQYQLDRYATVAEVVAHARELRVSQVYAPVHYMACDRTGACATLEYLAGRLVITQGKQLLVRTLTNDTYTQSAAHLRRCEGFGGQRPVGRTHGSLDRFARASAMARAAKGGSTDDAFRILRSVAQGDYTKWRIVYDPVGQRVAFQTAGAAAIKTVRLSAFDTSCAAPRQMLPLRARVGGDATQRFVPYVQAANRALLDITLKPIAARLPPGAVALLATYPATVTCAVP